MSEHEEVKESFKKKEEDNVAAGISRNKSSKSIEKV